MLTKMAIAIDGLSRAPKFILGFVACTLPLPLGFACAAATDTLLGG